MISNVSDNNPDMVHQLKKGLGNLKMPYSKNFMTIQNKKNKNWRPSQLLRYMKCLVSVGDCSTLLGKLPSTVTQILATMADNIEKLSQQIK